MGLFDRVPPLRASRAAASTPAAPVRSAAKVPQAVEKPEKERVLVLNKSDQIPDGVVVSGTGGAVEISAERRVDFVLIHAPNNHVHVMVSQEQYGKPAMFDVRRRVHDAGYQSEVSCATRDIIQIAYSHLKSSVIGTAEDSDTEIEALIDRLVDEAHRKKASDIHIETRGASADVMFRVNGVRIFHANVASETAHAMGKVLYSVHADSGSKDVTWDTQSVADGAIEWVAASDGARLQLRFSSSPIYPTGNFQIVIRILTMEGAAPPIAKLGYSQEQVDLLDTMSAGQNGIVILCGPTNSGKSTTLQSVIGRLFERRGKEIKIITVEDPVEYVIPGACQIPVARKRASLMDSGTGSVFSTFLRGTLRQDPDVVLVGEIRDLESAMVTRDLVLAGRKVFATLHANSALWAFMRLREIGLPWEVLTMPGFIAGVIYQRLLPRLCEHCAVPHDQAPEMTDDLRHRLGYVVDFSEHKIRFRGAGCKHCNGTGIAGRAAVAEMLVPDRALLKHLAANRFLEAEAHWRAGPGGAMRGGGRRSPVTVLQNAIEKMKQGLVSPVDVENQIGLLTAELVVDDLGGMDGALSGGGF